MYNDYFNANHAATPFKEIIVFAQNIKGSLFPGGVTRKLLVYFSFEPT